MRWFGVIGAPGAWTLQHVTGYVLTEAACGEAGWSVRIDAVTIAVTVLAALAAIGAEAAAIVTFRATRDATEPPQARVHFLATIGIAIAPLFLAMILMSGLGAAVLDACRQS